MLIKKCRELKVDLKKLFEALDYERSFVEIGVIKNICVDTFNLLLKTCREEKIDVVKKFFTSKEIPSQLVAKALHHKLNAASFKILLEDFFKKDCKFDKNQMKQLLEMNFILIEDRSSVRGGGITQRTASTSSPDEFNNEGMNCLQFAIENRCQSSSEIIETLFAACEDAGCDLKKLLQDQDQENGFNWLHLLCCGVGSDFSSTSTPGNETAVLNFLMGKCREHDTRMLKEILLSTNQDRYTPLHSAACSLNLSAEFLKQLFEIYVNVIGVEGVKQLVEKRFEKEQTAIHFAVMELPAPSLKVFLQESRNCGVDMKILTEENFGMFDSLTNVITNLKSQDVEVYKVVIAFLPSFEDFQKILLDCFEVQFVPEIDDLLKDPDACWKTCQQEVFG